MKDGALVYLRAITTQDFIYILPRDGGAGAIVYTTPRDYDGGVFRADILRHGVLMEIHEAPTLRQVVRTAASVLRALA